MAADREKVAPSKEPECCHWPECAEHDEWCFVACPHYLPPNDRLEEEIHGHA